MLDELVRHGGISVVLVACDQPALPGVDSDDLLILKREGVPGELLKEARENKSTKVMTVPVRSYNAVIFILSQY